jgi:uncharacterized protein YecE (DUF72 family)
MSELTNYTIYLGCHGWRHAEWQTSFYPDDLPEDWQLSYYNSQFRCVYLSSASWMDRTSLDAESWLADTHDNFRFVLEVPNALDHQSKQFLEAMDKRAMQVNADQTNSQLFWFPPEPDLRSLKYEIQSAVDQGRDLYLLNREAHLPSLEKVRSLVDVMGC